MAVGSGRYRRFLDELPHSKQNLWADSGSRSGPKVCCGASSIASKAGKPLAIGVTNTVTIQHLRVANAQTAISFVGGSGHVIRHAQLVSCQKGIAATNTDFSPGNALFWNVLTNLTGATSTGRVEHLTADTATYLNQNIGTSLFLTNCLLVQDEFKNARNGLAARWKPLERVKTHQPRPTPR